MDVDDLGDDDDDYDDLLVADSAVVVAVGLSYRHPVLFLHNFYLILEPW